MLTLFRLLFLTCLQGEVINLPEEIIVDKDHPQPSWIGDGRIGALLKILPEGYKVKVGVLTRWWDQSPTGLLSYALVMTPLNPADKPDGTEIHHWNWYQGPSRTVEYRNGLKHGVEKEYSRAQKYDEALKRNVDLNVLVAEIPWSEGKIHGTKRILHPNGKISSEIQYEQGVPTGVSRTFDDKGNLTKVIPYVEGKMDGEVKDFWPNGKPKRLVRYKQGKVDGLASEYYLSGQLKWERPFKNNLQNGLENHYEADGKLRSVKYWIDGEEVSKTKYQALK
ncbi:MAG: toxin-antitoxin system YwqK family antitoxin [Planctomycetota bacterium]|nr:toxin-antitoxin system YwqK family antitoxin [Planctomycetota bacterium]MDA1138422.1 toxin-antitoxin system YwqK family antitoxin [Planctomycetota bacterium]